ncbi:terminase [Nonomuraea wenchangensis]|uniref:Phage terminase-like protein, large subunit, contains N-terminal HTH domain n=1 Tax=Nonomuraea wenchangensis TaxID=568860 RepID=A0A1I0ETV3_9ACTN|nr:terminase [Nonomuraea wenchangensis]SET48535.1 Phage terminase-like protein, large subunit, contains N-terminal HTH domain [Nonomuraea wenchangensis]
MPWRPSYPGERPTLGWEVLAWIEDHLAAPDRSEYEPLILTKEQAAFVLAFYEINPVTGKRRYRRAVYSRPKGAGKSPLLSAICAAEGMGPVVPDGWDADGQPVGRPWSDIRTPWVQIAATSEDQTKNAWAPLLEMLREGPVMDAYPGLDPMDTFVALPKGRIEFVTAAATSREGNRPVHVCLDQTESWMPVNGGVRLAATLRRNLGKTGGSSIEAPNAYVPGEESVAEASAQYLQQILEGRAKDEGLLYDHREWPPETDMSDPGSLYNGLAYAYGDSANLPGGCRIHEPPCERRGWVDLDRIVAEIHDPATTPESSRQYYGNQVTHASDSWLSQPEWAACVDASKVVADGERITLGFDGSRHRERGVTDATALIGCRVSDGHLFEVAVWEQPDGAAGRDWWVPIPEVEAAVRSAFQRYRVVGFYADPAADWRSYVADWEYTYGRRLRVRSSQNHPIEWWMNRTNMVVRALEQLHAAIVNGELSHDGSFALTRHMLNARRRPSRSGLTIAKEHPTSRRKIDAAIAAMLAWQARLDAISKGLGRRGQGRAVVLR